jgi:hypothetical protein
MIEEEKERCETSGGCMLPFIAIFAAQVANQYWPRGKPLTKAGDLTTG